MDAAYWAAAGAVGLIMIVSLWRIFEKAGEKGWKALIPGYNVYTHADVVWSGSVFFGMIAMAGLMLEAGWIGAMASPGLGVLCTVVRLVALIGLVLLALGMSVKTGEAFNKSSGFTWGLVLLPVVFYPILAFGGSEYKAKMPFELSDLELLRLNGPSKKMYGWSHKIVALPGKFLNALKGLGLKTVALFKGIGHFLRDLVITFIKGDWKTKVSYVVMGFGSCARGQWGRGILFFLFQTVFNVYMFFPDASMSGCFYLGKLSTLGTVATYKEGRRTVYGDNSFFILLYGVLTLFFIAAFLYTWYLNIKQNKLSEQILKSGRKLKRTKDDLAALTDEQFHKTLLALPVLGVTVFTILPIIFMILVAFTNFDATHQPPGKLFTWVGWDNFRQLLATDTASYGGTFRQVLLWTLIWAFFATFLNYFLGMFVAIMINKKGIKLKKMWRTILVMTIAIPQFVSLLYVSKMFAADGLINSCLIRWGWIAEPIPFWTQPGWARFTVILINVWIGIPYLMLIATGILMNIPADLYESARIDGANAFQMYKKITLPYMLFVTGPYLLTSFTGNINNFNVIFLLSGGKPQSMELSGNAGYTDLLITWLYKMTVNDTNYKLAAVMGILVFVVLAVINLVTYNLIPSVKNEEDFQ